MEAKPDAAHLHDEHCHALQQQPHAKTPSQAWLPSAGGGGCARTGTQVLEVELLNGGLVDPLQPANVLFSELLSDWHELPVVPSTSQSGKEPGDEDTLVREFCRHTHNPPDSCAHKHVRVRSTNKRLKPNDAVEGPSADEEPAANGDGDGEQSDTPLARKRNREAVRKYRQRKREQTQSLTQEVEQLRLDNARLMAELQQHKRLKDELRTLRMILDSVRGAVNSVQPTGAGGRLEDAVELQLGAGGQVMCMLPPQQQQQPHAGGQVMCMLPQEQQQPQMQPAAQVGHEEHSSQQARFAMMQRFLEMQKENALLIRQTNPTS